MKIAKIVVSAKPSSSYEGGLFVIPVGKNEKNQIVTNTNFQSIVDTISEMEEFSGKNEETLTLYQSGKGDDWGLNSKRILFIGLGSIADMGEKSEVNEKLRIAGGLIAGVCKKSKVKNIGICVPDFLKGDDQAAFGEYVSEGILLGDYSFLKYKKDAADDDKPYEGIGVVEFYGAENSKKLRKACNRGVNAAIAGRVSRDMANEPGNGWTASDFASYARKMSKSLDMKCTVHDKKSLEKLGMGGILAVNQGSKEPPKLIIVDYNPGNAKETLLLVGKGLTFDSGGISIKPAQGMMDMKYDMCGGAAALSVMEAVGREKPQVRVVSIIPSTDNLSGGAALKPGDIITHYNGLTSEIENTDAEGRLILADALAYGIEKFAPTCVVDLATLTGAVIIALGHHHTGMMSNDDTLSELVIEAGRDAGEPVWRLPLGKEYVKQLKSQVADMKNTGGRPGGSITAAEYLHKFVGDTPWAHMDIAGTAWDFTEKSYIPKGPSGTGTRTLLYLIRNWKTGVLKK